MNTTSTALLFLSLSMLLYLFGPFRGQFLRRSLLMERMRATGTQAIVVLVHGTFARGAKWTQADHKFLNHIEAAVGPSEVHRLLWSGDNCQSQRIAAAEFLATWLQSHTEQVPIYLVGHSHGGAIAAMAATKVTDRPVRVVTMSTPFILVQARHASLLPLRTDDRLRDDESLLLFGVGLWLLAALIALVNPDLAVVFVILLMPMMWLFVAVFGLQPWIERQLRSGVARLREAGEQAVQNSLIRPAPASLLILRTPGDEASGALAAANLISWAITSVLRILGNAAAIVLTMEERARRLLSFLDARGILGLSIFLGAFCALVGLGFVISQIPVRYAYETGLWTIGICLTALPIFLLLILRVPYLVVAPALALLAAGLNFILALPFGIDLAARSPLVTVSAEPAPLGTWPITVSEAGRSFLAHSALYESALIEYALASFASEEVAACGSVGA